MGKKGFLTIGIFALSAAVFAGRSEMKLENGWRFSRQDKAEFAKPDFDDGQWQSVSVPHDWAIYGPFSAQNDKQNVAIVQDGQKEALEHAGRTGGLPFVGVGWYRLWFDAPKKADGKRVVLIFDGAMSEPQVFLNGEKVGEWKYGYNAFEVDVTAAVSESGRNLLAVRLENLPESSRWYPGAGLYRNVHLVTTEKTCIPTWGTQVLTPTVSKEKATVEVHTEVRLAEADDFSQVKLVTYVLDDEGEIVAEAQIGVLTEENKEKISQKMEIFEPKLWTLKSPNLYSVKSELYVGSALKDVYRTRFGVRSIEVKPDSGFYLNGERTIFKGVCNHHDLGPLGAAVNEAALRRQIRILQDMGCNAIRTSHNMPAPELVRLCDEMGMMLMAESFDEWQIAKCKNGYNRFFNDWAEKDLVNLLRQFRNSPSVVMWCIGNEVPNQGVAGEWKTAKFLQDICHREDPTRPVTQGMDNPDAVVNNNFAAVMDVPGFNYRSHKFRENFPKLPQRLILASETSSALSSRGVYKFPVERKRMAKYPDHQASSYDTEHVAWGTLPEDEFLQYETLPYCMGEFVWTGFDYLGEPTPYYEDWPSHSSLFGIIDLAGIPKDRYYLYRSFWNKEKPTLHLLPHWTWKGREGEKTPIYVYTSYPQAEVFINGKSQGRKKKDLSVGLEGTDTPEALDSLVRQKRYRLMWENTVYQKGKVKVVAYGKNGEKADSVEMKTAGKPWKIVLESDRDTLLADGKDLAFVRVKVVDINGNLCPFDEREIKFKVSGQGTFRAAANGKTTSLEPFHEPKMKVFSGQLTMIVQSKKVPFKERKLGGNLNYRDRDIVVKACAKGVFGAEKILKIEEE